MSRVRNKGKSTDGKKRQLLYILILIQISLIIVGIAILVEQHYRWGVFFDVEDFLHHENIAVILLVSAMFMTPIVLLASKK